MLTRPRVGHPVELRYGPGLRAATGLHCQRGVVRVVGRGPGPINHLVDLGERSVIVPRGNVCKSAHISAPTGIGTSEGEIGG